MEAWFVPGPRDEREAELFKYLNTGGVGLEIGPSFRPAAPKARGFNVFVADHASAAELREKYREVDGVENVEHVDFVLSAGLGDSVPLVDYFDYIIASHVIEHVPDFVQFLRDCAALLKPHGTLSLAVPDMRYCFDCARSLTSLGDVLRAHRARRTKPDPEDVLEHYLNCVSRDGLFAWHAGYCGAHAPMYTMDQVAFWHKKALAGSYVDVHCWRFTPASFRLLLFELDILQLIDLRIRGLTSTRGHEFFVSLGKGLDQSERREELLNAVASERAS